MKELASGKGGDIPLVIGESSAACMGVLLAVQKDATLSRALDLDRDSKVLLFGLEGATDPATYNDLCGQTPEEIFEAQENFLAQNRDSVML